MEILSECLAMIITGTYDASVTPEITRSNSTDHEKPLDVNMIRVNTTFTDRIVKVKFFTWY